MKKILLVLFFIATCNHAVAYSFMYKVPSGQKLRFSVLSESEKTCAVSSNQPQCKGTVSIPSRAICRNRSYEVIEIEEEAFSGMKNIDSVYLPTSIKKIGYRAFFGCSGIEILEVPSEVKTIELNAFYNVPYVHYEGKASGAPWGAKEIEGIYTIPSTPENSNVASRLSKTQKTQKTHDETWYRNYFKDHIAEIDPIEGVYDVQFVRYIKFIETNIYGRESIYDGGSGRYSCRWVIYRISENKFKIELLSSNLLPDAINVDDATITRIGETLIYSIDLVYASSQFSKEGEEKITMCKKMSTGTRFSLESLMGFVFVVNISNTCHCFSPYGEFDEEIKFHDEYSLIKEYPTTSMYDEKLSIPVYSSWSGTGWALGDGYLITNNHVADGARIIMVKGVGGDFNIGYTAEVIATDKINDIAILKINDNRFKGFGTLPYGVSSRIADVGEDVFVLGWPLGQDLGEEIKLTTGVVNARTGFDKFQNCYQIQAPITHGNSGGPMFDSKGNVIGIVVGGLNKELNLAENVGYAIKTSYLKILIESADLNIPFPNANTISALSLPEKVKRVKNFVYYIECSK